LDNSGFIEKYEYDVLILYVGPYIGINTKKENE